MTTSLFSRNVRVLLVLVSIFALYLCARGATTLTEPDPFDTFPRIGIDLRAPGQDTDIWIQQRDTPTTFKARVITGKDHKGDSLAIDPDGWLVALPMQHRGASIVMDPDSFISWASGTTIRDMNGTLIIDPAVNLSLDVADHVFEVLASTINFEATTFYLSSPDINLSGDTEITGSLTVNGVPITGGITDGDKGDITVSAGGTIWEINPLDDLTVANLTVTDVLNLDNAVVDGAVTFLGDTSFASGVTIYGTLIPLGDIAGPHFTVEGATGNTTIDGTLTVNGVPITGATGLVQLSDIEAIPPSTLLGNYDPDDPFPPMAISLASGHFSLAGGILSLSNNYQLANPYLTDLSDGSLSGETIGPGIDAANITVGDFLDLPMAPDATLHWASGSFIGDTEGSLEISAPSILSLKGNYGVEIMDVSGALGINLYGATTIDGSLTVTGDVALPAGAIGLTEMANLAQGKILGRSDSAAGPPQPIQVAPLDFGMSGSILVLQPIPASLDADLQAIANITLGVNQFYARTTAGTGPPNTGITIGPEFSLAGNTLSLANLYQPIDPDLTAIGGISLNQNQFYARTLAGAGPANLGITIGPEFSLAGNTLSLANLYQPIDPDLTALGGISLAQNQLYARTLAGTGPANAGITVGPEFSLAGNTLSLANIYQPINAHLTDLSDGTLTGSKVGTGINASNITTGVHPVETLPASTTFLGSTIDDAEITGLSATKITGTVPKETLPSTIAYTDSTNTFTAPNTFNTLFLTGVTPPALVTSGKLAFYSKGDGILYTKTPAGVETALLTGTGSGVAMLAGTQTFTGTNTFSQGTSFNNIVRIEGTGLMSIFNYTGEQQQSMIIQRQDNSAYIHHDGTFTHLRVGHANRFSIRPGDAYFSDNLSVAGNLTVGGTVNFPANSISGATLGTGIDAGDITVGTLDLARVPQIPASKIDGPYPKMEILGPGDDIQLTMRRNAGNLLQMGVDTLGAVTFDSISDLGTPSFTFMDPVNFQGAVTFAVPPTVSGVAMLAGTQTFTGVNTFSQAVHINNMLRLEGTGNMSIFGYGGNQQASMIIQRLDNSAYITHDGTATKIVAGNVPRLTIQPGNAYFNDNLSVASTLTTSNLAVTGITSFAADSIAGATLGTGIDAGDITIGTLDNARITALPASKVAGPYPKLEVASAVDDQQLTLRKNAGNLLQAGVDAVGLVTFDSISDLGTPSFRFMDPVNFQGAVTFATPPTISGVALLAGNQTFTGTNTFTQGTNFNNILRVEGTGMISVNNYLGDAQQSMILQRADSSAYIHHDNNSTRFVLGNAERFRISPGSAHFNGPVNVDLGITAGASSSITGDLAVSGTITGNIAAGSITSGTISSARLPANIALKDQANTFTATQQVTSTGGPQLTLRSNAGNYATMEMDGTGSFYFNSVGEFDESFTFEDPVFFYGPGYLFDGAQVSGALTTDTFSTTGAASIGNILRVEGTGLLSIFNYTAQPQQSMIIQRQDNSAYIHHDGTSTHLRVGNANRFSIQPGNAYFSDNLSVSGNLAVGGNLSVTGTPTFAANSIAGAALGAGIDAGDITVGTLPNARIVALPANQIAGPYPKMEISSAVDDIQLTMRKNAGNLFETGVDALGLVTFNSVSDLGTPAFRFVDPVNFQGAVTFATPPTGIAMLAGTQTFTGVNTFTQGANFNGGIRAEGNGFLSIFNYGGNAQQSMIIQRADNSAYIHHDGTATKIVAGGAPRLTVQPGNAYFNDNLTVGSGLTTTNLVVTGAVTDALTIGTNTSNINPLSLNGAAGSDRTILGLTAGVRRWEMSLGNSTAETGLDSGSNFHLMSRTDTGGSNDTPLTIARALNGAISLNRPVVVGGTLTVAGAVNLPAGSIDSNEIANGTIVAADLAGSVLSGYQPLDADLTGIANLTLSQNQFYARTGAGSGPADAAITISPGEFSMTATPGTLTIASVIGSKVGTGINASNITTGTLNSALLPGNIAYKDQSNVFTGGLGQTVSAGNQWRARYTSSDVHSSTLDWQALQLGNNGTNYIVGGRSVTGGSLGFVVNNTNDVSGSLLPNGLQAMTINSAGRVGIGTTSFGQTLNVQGTEVQQQSWRYDPTNYATISVGSTGYTSFDAVGSNQAFSFADDLSASRLVSTQFISPDMGSGNSMRFPGGNVTQFYNNGAISMSISAAKEVGIGGASVAQRALTAYSPTSLNLAAEFLDSTGVHALLMRPNFSGVNLIQSDYMSGSSYLPLALSARGGTSDLVLGTDGNIGIGNSLAVAGVLRVEGTGMISVNNYAGDPQKSLILQSANSSAYIYHDGVSTFHRVANADRFTLSPSGASFNDNVSVGGGLTVGGAVTLPAGSINSTEVDGTVLPFQSQSDFPTGTLVTTNIPAAASNGDSFVIEISGKSYSGTNAPFMVIAQGYLYNDTFYSTSGLSYGGTFAPYIKMLEQGGVLKFWWPTISYWNAFHVHVRADTGAGVSSNRVTAVTNAAEPTVTKKVQVNLQTALNGGGLATNYVPKFTGTALANSTIYDNGSNVGIGTTSPLGKLDVRGTAGGQIVASYDATHYSAVTVDSNGSTTFNGEGNSPQFYFADTLNAQTNLQVNGNTGLGQGAGVGYPLSVRRTTGGDWTQYINSTASSGYGLLIDADFPLYLRNRDGSQNYATVTSAGYVGYTPVSITGGNYFSPDNIYSRLWTPGQPIGAVSYAGSYGHNLTYLAKYSGGWKGLAGGTATNLSIGEGRLAFTTAPSSGVDAALTWTDRFIIQQDGKVGIGPGSATGSASEGRLNIIQDTTNTTTEADFGLKISDGTSDVALTFSVDSVGNKAVIQAMDPGTSWGGRDLYLQPNGGKVIFGGEGFTMDTLTLGRYGAANGIINTPEALYFNIDSTSSYPDTQRFEWAKNRTSNTGGVVLMNLLESGALNVNGTIYGNAGTLNLSGYSSDPQRSLILQAADSRAYIYHDNTATKFYAGFAERFRLEPGAVRALDNFYTSGSSTYVGGSMYHYKDLAVYGFNGGGINGIKKITMPFGWSSTMGTTVIRGYDYSASGAWEVVVSGYNSSGWYNGACEIRGKAPFSEVRLGYDGTKSCILLGNTTTYMAYPQIEVTDFYSSYSQITGWESGWSISNITTESGLSNIYPLTAPIYSNQSGHTVVTGNLGVGTANPVRQLTIDNSSEPTLGFYTGGTERVVQRVATDGNFKIEVAGSEKIRINANGRVVIGNSGAGTTAKLETYGDANIWGNYVYNGSAPGNSYGLLVEAGRSSGDYAIYVREPLTAAPFFYVRGDGKVAIGNTSFVEKLDVDGAIHAGTGATNGGLIMAGKYSGQNSYINTFSSMYSSAGTIIGYGVHGKNGSAVYASSTAAGISRSALNIDNYGLHYLMAPAQSTAFDSPVTMTERFTVHNATGNVSIGNAGDYGSGKLQVTNTAGPQLLSVYDGSNWATMQVGSTGMVTMTATGSNPYWYFPQSVSVGGVLYTSGISNPTTGARAYIGMNDSGTSVNRTVADGNAAFQVIQGDAGSTGDIMRLSNSTGVVSKFAQDGSLTIGSNTSNLNTLTLKGAAGTDRVIMSETNGSRRWEMKLGDATGESGLDFGSQFVLQARNDSGGAIDTPIRIPRTGGYTMVFGRPANFAGKIMAGIGSPAYLAAPPGPIFGQYTSTIGYLQAPNGGELQIWDDGTATIATFTDNHRFGLGTPSPEAKIHVSGSAETTFTNVPRLASFTTTNAAAQNMGGGISFGGLYDGAGNNALYGYVGGVKENATLGNYAGKLVFGVRANLSGGEDMTRMTILSNGNVGVGTSAPTGKLQATATSGAQIVAAYDASNQMTTTVDSVGGVTLDAAGVAPSFSIADALNVTGGLTTGTASVTRTYASSVNSPTLGAGATTFAISSNYATVTGNASPNTVSTITGGTGNGMVLYITFTNSNVTMVDDASGGTNTVNLSGAGVNFTSSSNDVLTLLWNGSSWREVSRSVN